MFVRSRMSKDAVYRKGGKEWVIKAGTMSLIDENLVSAKELKSLYGSRIDVISRSFTEKKVEEVSKIQKKEVKEPVKKVKPPKKLDNKLIDNILDEIQGAEKKKVEESKKEEAPKKVEESKKEEAPKKVEESKKEEAPKTRTRTVRATRRSTAKKTSTRRATRKNK